MAADNAKPQPTYSVTPYKDIKGEWRWRMVAPNGRLVADSGEGYKTRAGVMRAIERLVSARIAVQLETSKN